ncbi:P1 family peptidase [Alicyclobacillus sp. ALC3]|nr:P1 family peptidase [Alicyclobacillus sp. ALC3]
MGGCPASGHVSVKCDRRQGESTLTQADRTTNQFALLPGIRVGHAQDEAAATGCTVIVVPGGATAGVDVRGGAPGTRETDLLSPLNTVECVHAVLLTGGSAFGLDAAAGVMRYLEAQGVGFDTQVAKVPIVVGAVLFDLAVGSAAVRPDAEMGYQACLAAGLGAPDEVATGSVGAGTGATVGKLAGLGSATKSGIGFARERWGDLEVQALIAVNAVGEVVEEAGNVLAGVRGSTAGTYVRAHDLLRAGAEATASDRDRDHDSSGGLSTNTTIGCLWTNARLTKAQAAKVAQMSHDGLARSIQPIHTPHDGDTMFALSVGDVPADMTVVGALAAIVTAAAVRDAVRSATDLAGLPSAASWRG